MNGVGEALKIRGESLSIQSGEKMAPTCHEQVERVMPNFTQGPSASSPKSTLVATGAGKGHAMEDNGEGFTTRGDITMLRYHDLRQAKTRCQQFKIINIKAEKVE